MIHVRKEQERLKVNFGQFESICKSYAGNLTQILTGQVWTNIVIETMCEIKRVRLWLRFVDQLSWRRVVYCNGGGAPTGNLSMFGRTVIVFSQLK